MPPRVEEGRVGQHAEAFSVPTVTGFVKEIHNRKAGRRAARLPLLTDAVALSERRAIRAGGCHVPHAVHPVHEADVIEAKTVGLVMPTNPGKGVGGSRLSLEQLLEEAGHAPSPERAKAAGLCKGEAGEVHSVSQCRDGA